jgi:CRP-like cAMP-binding protein
MGNSIFLPSCLSCKNRRGSYFGKCRIVPLLRENTKNKKALFFQAGEVIFTEGDFANRIYCIYSGKVKLFRNENGKEATIYEAGPGEIIGFTIKSDGSKCNNSAETVEDTFACYIQNDDFIDISRTINESPL